MSKFIGAIQYDRISENFIELRFKGAVFRCNTEKLTGVFERIGATTYEREQICKLTREPFKRPFLYKE